MTMTNARVFAETERGPVMENSAAENVEGAPPSPLPGSKYHHAIRDESGSPGASEPWSLSNQLQDMTDPIKDVSVELEVEAFLGNGHYTIDWKVFRRRINNLRNRDLVLGRTEDRTAPVFNNDHERAIVRALRDTPTGVKLLLDNINKLACEGLGELGRQASVMTLSALAGEHTLLLAPPGVSTRLVASRLQRCFGGFPHLEHIITPATVEEELFGTAYVDQIRAGTVPQKCEFGGMFDTSAFLPESGTAFLGEVFQANEFSTKVLFDLLRDMPGTRSLRRQPNIWAGGENRIDARITAPSAKINAMNEELKETYSINSTLAERFPPSLEEPVAAEEDSRVEEGQEEGVEGEGGSAEWRPQAGHSVSMRLNMDLQCNIVTAVGAASQLPGPSAARRGIFECFMTRLWAGPMTEQGFRDLIIPAPLALSTDSPIPLRLTLEEVVRLREKASHVSLPHRVHEVLVKYCTWMSEEHGRDITYSRFHRLLGLMRMSAYTNARMQVSELDCWLVLTATCFFMDDVGGKDAQWDDDGPTFTTKSSARGGAGSSKKAEVRFQGDALGGGAGAWGSDESLKMEGGDDGEGGEGEDEDEESGEGLDVDGIRVRFEEQRRAVNIWFHDHLAEEVTKGRLNHRYVPDRAAFNLALSRIEGLIREEHEASALPPGFSRLVNLQQRLQMDEDEYQELSAAYSGYMRRLLTAMGDDARVRMVVGGSASDVLIGDTGAFVPGRSDPADRGHVGCAVRWEAAGDIVVVGWDEVEVVNPPTFAAVYAREEEDGEHEDTTHSGGGAGRDASAAAGARRRELRAWVDEQVGVKASFHRTVTAGRQSSAVRYSMTLVSHAAPPPLRAGSISSLRSSSFANPPPSSSRAKFTSTSREWTAVTGAAMNRVADGGEPWEAGMQSEPVVEEETPNVEAMREAMEHVRSLLSNELAAEAALHQDMTKGFRARYPRLVTHTWLPREEYLRAVGEYVDSLSKGGLEQLEAFNTRFLDARLRLVEVACTRLQQKWAQWHKWRRAALAMVGEQGPGDAATPLAVIDSEAAHDLNEVAGLLARLRELRRSFTAKHDRAPLDGVQNQLVALSDTLAKLGLGT